ncbi:hypothetical protein H257_19435, partial [Aphanomyces astaci]
RHGKCCLRVLEVRTLELGVAPDVLSKAVTVGEPLTNTKKGVIAVWDETHKEVKVGQLGSSGSKRQVRFPRDEDGHIDCVNGQYAPPGTYLKMKYPRQAHFSLG